MASRAQLLATADTVIIATPTLADLQELREGGVLWGYVHCAQQRSITQAAIDRGHLKRTETLARALNIEDGMVRKPAILSFQNRAPDYPHAVSDRQPNIRH